MSAKGEVARRDSKDLIRAQISEVTGALLPERFHEIINFRSWVEAIALGEKYKEPDPEFTSRMLAILTMSGDTPEQVFSGTGVMGLQKMIPDQPGAKLEAFEITDLYVASSDLETGHSCYVIVSGISLIDGESFKFTTGATNIQVTLIGLLNLGVWPIRACIKRGDSKDKGGRYLLHMLPPE